VYAVEKDRKGIELIKKNSQKFGMNNVNIVKGEAPGILNGFPLADRIIVGGSGGKLDEILRKGKKKLKKQGRIVITAVTIDTLSQAKKSLERLNLTFNICNIAVTRAKKVADYQMLKGMNPVFIISAVKEDINDR
jgi:precorrin-6B methylase 2